MHYNKQQNDLMKNEINGHTFSKTDEYNSAAVNDGVTSSSFQTDSKINRFTEEQNEALDIEKNLRVTKTSCTSSTDSGVNINENDELPTILATSAPPSSFSSSSSSSSLHTHSIETTTAENQCHKIFHKNNKNTIPDNNNVNNYKGNNCEIINKNGDNDVDHDDETDNVVSENVDNKLKLLNVDNAGNCTRYQEKMQNIAESKKAISVGQQRNLQTLTADESLTTATTATTTLTNDNKQHEFVNLQQRPASTSSSLSTSSTTNSYDNNNLPSNMQQNHHHHPHHFKGSPVVSIRSISSTIITSDSDADSDFNSDIDGDHENYVIKKLGTEVIYSANDPQIPNIHSGHTVLNQKVIPNSNQDPLPALAALAVIGDRIGVAQSLGPGPSSSAAAQRPQIGSIALSNSTDVTFGDKHFYEGPVTIQQFLIDGRDKRQQTNEKDNPTFSNEDVEVSLNNAKDSSSSPAQKSNKLYEHLAKRKKIIIPGILILTALLVVATMLGSKMLNGGKNDSHGNDGQECEGNGTLCLIERDVWRAHPQKNNLDKQALPLHRVVISHTASEACESINICAQRVRVIQEFHMYSLGWDDIAYNFLISSDGRVYVGRGWDFVGAHTKGYNHDSVGISFIGTYISIAPTEEQLNACLSLLDEGVRLKKLSPDYRLYGARQLGATESPGDMLYQRIKKWQHWSANINLT